MKNNLFFFWKESNFTTTTIARFSWDLFYSFLLSYKILAIAVMVRFRFNYILLVSHPVTIFCRYLLSLIFALWTYPPEFYLKRVYVMNSSWWTLRNSLSECQISQTSILPFSFDVLSKTVMTLISVMNAFTNFTVVMSSHSVIQ